MKKLFFALLLFSISLRAETVKVVEVDGEDYMVKEKRGKAFALPQTLKIATSLDHPINFQCDEVAERLRNLAETLKKCKQLGNPCQNVKDSINDLRYEPIAAYTPVKLSIPIYVVPIQNAATIEKELAKKTGFTKVTLVDPWFETEKYEVVLTPRADSISHIWDPDMTDKNAVTLNAGKLVARGRDVVCDLKARQLVVVIHSSYEEQFYYDPPGMKWDFAWKIYSEIIKQPVNLSSSQIKNALLIGSKISSLLIKSGLPLYKDEDVLKIFDATYEEDLQFKTYALPEFFRNVNFPSLMDSVNFTANFIVDLTGL